MLENKTKVKCFICDKTFSNNMGGQLTSHIINFHNITMEEYIIISEYDNIPPLCSCGFCSNNPNFSRGKFKKYFGNHNSIEYRQNEYVKHFGAPKCFVCGEDSGFNRTIPKTICLKCLYGDNLPTKGKIGPFNSKIVQDKIRLSIKEKYGVDNVSKLDCIKDKIREKAIGKVRYIPTYEQRLKRSELSKLRWSNPEIRHLMSSRIREATNTEEVRERRRYIANKKLNDGLKPSFMTNNRMSKLHIKIRNELKLSELGFCSEYQIGRYFVDEINLDCSLIIEINGNHVHGNPKIYLPDDIINIGYTSFLAKDKWLYDFDRKQYLISEGYSVITIWENDDLSLAKSKILKFIWDNYD